MYEHDNFIYHSAKGSSWKSHKYITKIGDKYIYAVPRKHLVTVKEDLEEAKKKLKQGAKKVSDWNKSGKTSKYDKNISDIKKKNKKAVKARKDSAKKEAKAYSNKMSSYAKIASEKTKKNSKAKAPSTVTAEQKAAAKRYSAKPTSTATAKRNQTRQDLINKSTKGSQYAEKVNQISSSRAKNKKVVTNQVPGNNNIQDRYDNATYSKKKKKKNNNVVLPAGYNTNYRNAANKAYE